MMPWGKENRTLRVLGHAEAVAKRVPGLDRAQVAFTMNCIIISTVYNIGDFGDPADYGDFATAENTLFEGIRARTRSPSRSLGRRSGLPCLG